MTAWGWKPHWAQSRTSKLCLEAEKKARHIKGHNNDNEEDNGVDNDSMGLETSLGTVKEKQAWS